MGESWSRSWTESTVVGGRGERAEPEVRTPKQTERDGAYGPIGGDSGWSGHGYFASGREGWKPPFHGYAVSFTKEEVWANLSRGTGPKALASEGNDEGGISPVDKPAVQFGSFIHLGYSFGGMSTQRPRRGTRRVGFHP